MPYSAEGSVDVWAVVYSYE